MSYLLKFFFWPFAIMYWIITYIRNYLYSKNYLKHTSFSIPIISVGNITVGGTGKTPHVQFIADILSKYSTAIVSRGYKRHSEGFLVATNESTVYEIGDESYLLKKLCPSATIAVCENRVEGITKLLKEFPNIQTIILDDAFQHRAIKPGLQIVLIDYNRPIWKDCVFPAGYLREGTYALQRADILIVTKCPTDFSQKQQTFWKKKLRKYPNHIFFSSIEYNQAYEYESRKNVDLQELCNDSLVLLVTGIAQPKTLYKYINTFVHKDYFTHISFPDHHEYTAHDYTKILEDYNPTKTKLITTEKDAQKLAEITRNQIPIYVVPIQPRFLFDEEQEFKNLIFEYISNKK